MIARSLLTVAAAAAMLTDTACSAQPAKAPAVPAVALAGCTRESAAVDPFVRERHEDKHARHLSDLNSALRGPKADVLFMGDSIVERWPQSDLQRAFPGQRVLNLGNRGERISDMLYRLRATLSPASRLPGSPDPGMTNYAAQSPELVVVLIGTNDLRGKSNCYIAEGTVEIATALKTLYPKSRLVFLGILPRGNPQGQFADQIAVVNRAVADTAKRAGWFETASIDAGYTCKPAVPCTVAIPPNFVHPSDQSYVVLSDTLRDRLASPR